MGANATISISGEAFVKGLGGKSDKLDRERTKRPARVFWPNNSCGNGLPRTLYLDAEMAERDAIH